MKRLIPKTHSSFSHGTIAFLILIFLSNSLFSQHYEYKGLELYNPHLSNIAFTGVENLLQVDLLGYRASFFNRFDAGAMGNIAPLNSTVGLYYSRTSYDSYLSSNGIRGVWAYHHSFSDDLVLNGALSYDYGVVENQDGGFSGGSGTFSSLRYGTAGVGASLYYKRARVGVSSGIPLLRKREVFTAPGETEIQDMEKDGLSFNLLASYGFGKKEGFYIEPVFVWDYSLRESGNEMQGYLGAKMMSRNWWGLGFTVGNLVSFSAFVNILDKVELILGLYGGEHDLFGSMGQDSYLIGNDLEFIGQIRIKL